MKREQQLKTKEYSNGEVTIVWQPELCYHSKNCVNSLPTVFDANQRPWIEAEGSTTANIVETIRKCPSGALTYYMNKTGLPLPEDRGNSNQQVALSFTKNGPIVVEGDVELLMPDGDRVVRKKRTALCRCGASQNKPFCDGSHKKINFTD